MKKLFNLFFLLIFVMSSLCACEKEDFPIAEEFLATESVDVIEPTLSLSMLPSYVQSGYTETTYFDLDSYASIPPDVWDRATYPTVYGKAIKMGSNAVIIQFFNQDYTWRQMNKNQPYFTVFHTGTATMLYDTDYNLKSNALIFLGVHSGNVGSNKYPDITAP